jgi:hypothetical protein
MSETNTKVGSSRGKQNYDKSGKLRARRLQRQREADIRQSQYDVLSTKEKLATIPKGCGNKQRAKLEALLKAEKAEKKASKTKNVGV